MLKRVPVLVAVVLALLVSTAAFAGKPAPRLAHEAFLQSLELPAGAAVTLGVPFTPSSLGNVQTKACSYQCKSCGVNKVKLCWAGSGCTSGCEACHNGTTCSF